MTTELMGQIAAVSVVTVIKDSHVTRRRGCVQRDVTPDTRGSTVTNVRYILTSFRILFHIEFNETFWHNI